MYIKKVTVKGFKSLADFELELSPFTCLIGLNGCGKSTVLQFFDFIAHVLAGDVEKWFEAREWEPGEELSAWGATEISFRLEFLDGSSWEGTYNGDSRVCREEEIRGISSYIRVDQNGGFFEGLKLKGIGGSDGRPWTFEPNELVYSGSITSILKDETLPAEIKALKTYIHGMRSFDTLAPQYLRQRDRSARSSIGHSGEFLATYIGGMPDDAREAVIVDLVDLYPHMRNIIVRDLEGGWNEILLHEEYESLSHLMTRSRHINDGFLRLVAVLAELRSKHSFLLFDEIENGINPEMVEALLEKLTGSPHQVLVTTHSPMILNYLDDDLARQSVVFLYKGPDGATRAKRFFDISSISEKLDVMGPGEAFVDTNLVALTEELNAAVAGA